MHPSLAASVSAQGTALVRLICPFSLGTLVSGGAVLDITSVAKGQTYTSPTLEAHRLEGTTSGDHAVQGPAKVGSLQQAAAQGNSTHPSSRR